MDPELSHLTDTLHRERVTRTGRAWLEKWFYCGQIFAVKRFSKSARLDWALQVASYECCPQPELVSILSHGLDSHGKPWLLSRWVDAPVLRDVLKSGSQVMCQQACNWLNAFQGRVEAEGYHWIDAAPRNVLVETHTIPQFHVVDFSVRPLAGERSLVDRIDKLETTVPSSADFLGEVCCQLRSGFCESTFTEAQFEEKCRE